jgi:hypothetical protein
VAIHNAAPARQTGIEAEVHAARNGNAAGCAQGAMAGGAPGPTIHFPSNSGHLSMASSLYDISVRSYLQTLDALCNVLDKGSAHCAETGTGVDELLNHRIAEDMLPLSFQLHMAVTHSLGTIEGIRAGLFQPPRGIPDLDYAGFRQRIGETAGALRALTRDDVDGLAGKAMIFRIGEMEMPFTAEDFVLSFSLPNIYFHVTATYLILRGAGVPLGKRDFLGQMHMAV